MDVVSNTDALRPLSFPVVCLVGPTASGKTELSQQIAAIIDAEIISADSMQIYRGMDIGTGKILPSDRLIKHYGLDIVNPGEAFSVQLFQTYARKIIEKLNIENRRALICGGTGFYIKAAVDDYVFPEGEQVDNPIREKYMNFLEEFGEDALWSELNKHDSLSAKEIHPHNTRRVIRALELYESGRSYAEQKANLAHILPYYPSIFVGLEIQPDILRDRIDRRVDEMINEGLVEEVKSLLEQGFRTGLTSQQAIGYKEIVLVLDGEIRLEEAIERIKIATHRYAKRQRSWFKHDKRVHWIKADLGITSEVVQEAISVIESSC